MANPSPSARPGPRSPDLRRLLLLDIVLPFLAIVLLERNGEPPLAAYAIGSLFPIASVVGLRLKQRRLDVIGIGIVLGIASGLLLGWVSADPRFGLVRAAPGFALFGLACLASLFTARPLMFFVARAVTAGSDPARIAAWNQRLRQRPFHQTMRRLTLVWGIGALIESALGIALVFLLPEHLALVAEPLVAFGIVAALLGWTRSVQPAAPGLAAAPAIAAEERPHA